MPRNAVNPHQLRHAAALLTAAGYARPAPPPERQCRAVIARLEELSEPGHVHGTRDPEVAFGLSALPDPTRWGGRGDLPWGHPDGGGHISRGVRAVRAGRSGYFFKCGNAMLDTLRDAFFDLRFRTAHAGYSGHGRLVERCDCVRIAMSTEEAASGHVNIEAQLELLRRVLRHIAHSAPEVHLDLLAADLFGDQRTVAEFYVWRLETEGFLAHAERQRLDSLMLSAEGSATLLMLEITRPGANTDALSARAMFEATRHDEYVPRIEFIHAPDATGNDIPRFKSARL